MFNKEDRPFPFDRGFIVYCPEEGYDIVWLDEDNGRLYIGVYLFIPDDWTHWAELPEVND